ncbi:type II secretion system GspH family protein [Clostridium tagluense]|uniref:type IV pilus modification PilV family protein n=1 Tax=Clostridium tagluense TaxID=360422 RepID=UPI001CF1AAF2|nr:type II secretion system protein [Clostridium tagluense]MCB2312655.1 type II secretion system GspH family protein [Clostridium tagluense]MCB2317421.1 type II secretion system GspH family protein [Clostridium tagluense]MCB2322230.1 type II secretion system GspH family protein [Clostridium tagluense]MCB2327236.1 type II secretion system GspH family protein [Clostridium tagluense]MCB2331922.1 type II secretion system GspH family protein [Clostridium tagluense]
MEGIKYKKGFTLIEVILSLAILSIVIGPILSLTTSTVKINKKSDNKIQAVNIAQKYLEEIKSSEYVIDNNTIFPMNESIKEKEFEVLRTINQVEEYKINDKNVVNIKYDAEVENNVEKRNGIPLDLNIKTVGIDQIDMELKASASNNVNVKLSVDKPIDIYLTNNSSRELKVYFIKESKQYSIKKCDGQISVFTNVSQDTTVNTNNYRLYKITVEVKKNNETLQKIEGYKTFLE